MLWKWRYCGKESPPCLAYANTQAAANEKDKAFLISFEVRRKARREITKLKWRGMCNLAVQWLSVSLVGSTVLRMGWSRQAGDWLQRGATIDVGQEMRDGAGKGTKQSLSQPSLHPGLTKPKIRSRNIARLRGSMILHSNTQLRNLCTQAESVNWVQIRRDVLASFGWAANVHSATAKWKSAPTAFHYVRTQVGYEKFAYFQF